MLAGSGGLYLLTVGQTFEELEQQQEQVEIERVQAVLQTQIDDVQYIAEDFGHWDLTYQYAVDRDPAYLEANLGSGETAFLEVDAVLFFDTENQAHSPTARPTDTAKAQAQKAVHNNPPHQSPSPQE